MATYYNEIDPHAAEWLRNLIAAGHLPAGDVDTRSIEAVQPADLKGYRQAHFFAGIGGWSLALRMAGWPDDRPVWTGSCPCQPFSAAGKRGGMADARHLWPDFHRLIAQCRPPVVFGEQVASKDGLGWLDAVLADLEGSGYAGAAVDLCAAGIGAPHIRQRLWWVGERVANAAGERPQGGLLHGEEVRYPRGLATSERGGCHGGLADAHGGHPSAEGLQRGGEYGQQPEDGSAGWLADAGRHGAREHAGELHGDEGQHGLGPTDSDHAPLYRGAVGGVGHNGRPGPTDGQWRDADWLFCRDGKWRPVGPRTFPLAHGVPGRVGRLRAYGNAIVPQVAAEVIAAFMDASE